MRSSLLRWVAAALCVAVYCAQAHGQTVTSSAIAPTIDGADIANLTTTGRFDAGPDQGHVWSNRPLQGQTFTTLNNPLGYSLSSVTLHNSANTTSGSFTVRVGTVVGNIFTPTVTQTSTNTPSYTSGDYMTFNFAAPVVLQPHTRYGFDWDATTNGFVTSNTNDGNYLGGEAFSNGSAGNPNNAALLGRGVDRVFHADLQRITGTFHVGGDNAIGSWTETTTEQNAVFANGATGRFLRISERQGTDSRFHLSEIEAFAIGVTPNNAGPASTNGPALSTNDLAAVGFHAATTTTALEHGNPLSVFNNLQETGANVWSTANDQMDPQPRFTLDLGSNVGVEIVRVYARDENCCTSRFANLRVELFADDGAGNPGTLVAGSEGPDNATGAGADQGGTTAPLVTTLQRKTSADLVATLFNDITYSIELNGTTDTSDKISLDNPDSNVYTTVLELNGAEIEIEMQGNVEAGDVFQIFEANQIVGPLNLTLPELPSNFIFDTSNLLVDGTLAIQQIPEPLSVASWLVAACAALFVVRRRRKA